MIKGNPVIIGVIGAGKCSRKLEEQAYDVGAAIASHNAILVCGGRGGVMEAAARGAKDNAGVTIGILPGNTKEQANPNIDIIIPTGIGEARNVVVVNTADALIAMHGRYGTITEIAFALKSGKPVISPFVWTIFPEIETIPDIKQAVKTAIDRINHAR